MVVFGKSVDSWHAALLAISNIDRVLEVLAHRAKAEQGPRYFAIKGKMAQLRSLRKQAYALYLNGGTAV